MRKKLIILIMSAACVSLAAPGSATAIVEFNAVFARDPFTPMFPAKEAKEGSLTQGPFLKEEVIQPPTLIVQGLVWGTNLPQAIVENKVVRIGDHINEAEVVRIDKEGIMISYKGKTFTIRPESPVLKKKQSGEGL
jgi:hypothetical protein